MTLCSNSLLINCSCKCGRSILPRSTGKQAVLLEEEAEVAVVESVESVDVVDDTDNPDNHDEDEEVVIEEHIDKLRQLVPGGYSKVTVLEEIVAQHIQQHGTPPPLPSTHITKDLSSRVTMSPTFFKMLGRTLT
jgi:hypothetical protein